ncbi:MAG: ribosomal protein S18-alanine N-acetyltransferase [Bacilli bacterium]
MLRESRKEEVSPFSKTIEYIENSNVIGYLKYSLIYDRIEIDNIYVEEKYRMQGIGNKLMSYLISKAIENRVVNITLEVRISNEIARNLYKKFGFREVAIRKYYYGDEDAILMEKQVM